MVLFGHSDSYFNRLFHGCLVVINLCASSDLEKGGVYSIISAPLTHEHRKLGGWGREGLWLSQAVRR